MPRAAAVETSAMAEIGVAIGLLAGIAALAATLVIPPAALLVAGAWTVAGGLAFGVPTGALYHVALHRSLRAAACLPARWWWNPTALHDRIPAADRFAVLGWCYAGAAGFLVTVLGCAFVAIAAWRGI